MKITDEMVDRFLQWPLPESVCADPCATKQQFIEARAMLEHVLGDSAEARLSAPSATLPKVPDGWMVVPTRPTPAMLKAGGDVLGPKRAARAYAAMLDAADPFVSPEEFYGDLKRVEEAQRFSAPAEGGKLVPTPQEIARRDIALTEAAHDLLVACDMEQHNEDIFKGKWKKGSKSWSGEFVRTMRLEAMAKIRALTEPGKSASAKPSSALADELEALASKATGGPWAWDQRGEKVNEWGLGTAFNSTEKQYVGHFKDEDAVYDEYVCSHEAATCNYSDPELICALRNNLPSILASLRGAAVAEGGKPHQDSVRLDWLSLHKADFSYFTPGVKWNGVTKKAVELEWSEDGKAVFVDADTIREALDLALAAPSGPNCG